MLIEKTYRSLKQKEKLKMRWERCRNGKEKQSHVKRYATYQKGRRIKTVKYKATKTNFTLLFFFLIKG